MSTTSSSKNVVIARAKPVDSTLLSELTFRSKAHWGYPEEQMLAWRDELRIAPEYISNHEVYMSKIDNTLIGFYAYREIEVAAVKLDYFFLDPDHMGKGNGKFLITDFLDRAKKERVQKVTLDADPNAEAFYQKFGFKTVDKLKSSIPGRFLPIMELSLKDF